MRLWNELMSQPVRKARIQQELPARSAAEVHVFERRDGSLIVAAWLRPAGVARNAGAALSTDERRETLDVQLAGGGPWQVRVHRSALKAEMRGEPGHCWRSAWSAGDGRRNLHRGAAVA